MVGLNKAILIGNLGSDPKVNYLENGTAVATFSIATHETYKDRSTGEKKKVTDWHNIVLWRGLAEVAEKYLKKGDKVYIEGKIKTRSYKNKDGHDTYVTEIVGNNMIMLGSIDQKNTDLSRPSSADESKESPQANENMEDIEDLPF